MGRIFPIAEHETNHHALLALSFYIACIAATLAVVSPLCGKKSTPPAESNSETKENQENVVPPLDGGTPPNDTITSPPEAVVATPGDHKNDHTSQLGDEDHLKQPLPPPPAMVSAAFSANHSRTNSIASQSQSQSQSQAKLTSSTSTGKLLSSLSLSVITNGLSSRQASRREDNEKKHDYFGIKLKHEDSIWKKTIILGEKCKVPDEDEDEPVHFDEKGNRISTYHPRTPSTISRQTSYAIHQEPVRKKDGNS